jgi:hypothetical protein
MQPTAKVTSHTVLKSIQATLLADIIEAYLYANESFVISQAENYLLEKFVTSSNEYLQFLNTNSSPRFNQNLTTQ